jgi:bifunctional DNase/RNase
MKEYVRITVVSATPAQEESAAVVLRAETGEELTLQVACAEGIWVRQALRGKTTPLPTTPDLLVTMLAALGAQVELARFEELDLNVLHASLLLRRDDERLSFPCRVGDALNVALRADAPIFIERDVLAACRKQGEARASGMVTDDLLQRAVEAAGAGLFDKAAHDTPIVRIVNTMLTKAVEDRAERLVIRGGERNVRVSWGPSDRLSEKMLVPGYVHGPLIARLRLLAELDPGSLNDADTGAIGLPHPQGDWRLRVEFVPGAQCADAELWLAPA